MFVSSDYLHPKQFRENNSDFEKDVVSRYFIFQVVCFPRAGMNVLLSAFWFVAGLILKMTTQLFLSNWFCPTCVLFCCCDFSDPWCEKNSKVWVSPETFFSDWHLSVSWFNLTGTLWFCLSVNMDNMDYYGCVAVCRLFFLVFFVYLYFQRLC